MLDIKFDMFFDRPAVQAKMKRGIRGPLSKAGAFVRQRAKSSIRKRKAPAKEGQPPSSHSGELRKLIFFAFDAGTESTVVGPLLFRHQSPTVPQVLEGGGKAKVRRRRLVHSGNGRQASPKQKEAYRRLLQEGRLQTPTRVKVVEEIRVFRKFPFMGPALEAEKPKFPGLFTDCIK